MRRAQSDYRRWAIRYLLGFISVLLLGCSKGFAPVDGVKMPRKVAGTSDSQAIALQAKLARLGVEVVTIGEDYLISIPSAILFPEQSPEIAWRSYSVLNHVVSFLKQFRKVAVNVTGFATPYVSTRREYALTLARAKTVSNYLWSQGIDSRFIFAEGAGREKPITGAFRGGDQSANSRIEITFRDMIV